MDTKNPLESIEKAKKMTQGKGLFGWLIKLFVGKNSLSSLNSTLNIAQQQLQNVQSQQQIRLTGTKAKATVLKIEDTGMLLNHNPVVNLTVRVSPESGEAFEKTFQTVVSKIAIPRINDLISISYNPSNPEEIALDQ